jgi:capsular exopolysaccharide synthesis family protein
MESRDRAGTVAPLRDVTESRFTSSGDQAIEQPATVRGVLETLKRRKWFVLQAVVLVPLAAAAVSLLQQPTYSATSSVLLTSGRAGAAAGAEDGLASDRRARTEADLARVPSMVVGALRRVPSTDLTVDEFLDRSSVTPRANSDIVDFSVSDPSPERARALATAYAREYVADRPGASRATVRSVLVSAAPKAERVKPRPVQMIALGAVLGIILAVAGAYLWDALDTKVRDVREVGRLLGLPLLGTFREVARPSYGRLAMIDAPHEAEAEAYRILRANLDFANIDRSARVVLVTGAVDGEGRSTTAANLAVAVALAGRRVVLADADLRHPIIADLFGLGGLPGLTDVALGHVSLGDALAPVPLGPPDAISPANGPGSGGSLEVLPSGPTPIDSGEFVGTRAVAEVVAELAERADLVILDAPPLLPVGDARTLTTLADALLVVTNLDLVRRPMLQELAHVLATMPTRVLGFVATGTTADRHDAYGGFYRRSASARRSERAA